MRNVSLINGFTADPRIHREDDQFPSNLRTYLVELVAIRLPSLSMLLQEPFCLFEFALLSYGEVFTSAIDVKLHHSDRRTDSIRAHLFCGHYSGYRRGIFLIQPWRRKRGHGLYISAPSLS